MKKILSILALTACFALLSGCNKDDDPGPSKNIAFKVNGKDFKPKYIEAYRDGDHLTIEAFNFDPTDPDEYEDGSGIEIYINLDEIDEDAYDIEDMSSDELSIRYYDEGEMYYAIEGEIEFTTLTKNKVEATFDLVLVNSYDEEDEIEIDRKSVV